MAEPQPVRVLIVDDSAFVRRAVERMLAGPDIRIVGAAATGGEAVAMASDLRPDVIIMDVNMPDIDGLQALQRIMKTAPTGVLMLSTDTREGASTTLRALDLGAVDFLDKSSAGTVMDIYGLGPALREKVLTVAGAAVRPPEPEPQTRSVSAAPAASSAPAPSPYEVVVIGTSTGGPRALVEVLARLPESFGVGLVIAQHMPSGFTQTLAERLDRRCSIGVSEAADRDPVRPGHALLAPGGTQIALERSSGELLVRVEPGPKGIIHRPSVDLLFDSVARVCGARAIGVVLTGMGDDGSRGLQAMRDAGARTLAESEETAVIYGMPRAAAPAAEQVLPLTEIGPALVALSAGASPSPERPR